MRRATPWALLLLLVLALVGAGCSTAADNNGGNDDAKQANEDDNVDLTQGGDHVLGNPVPSHQRGGLLVIAGGVVPEVLDERDDDVDRGHLGAGALRDDVRESEVVDVLVGDDQQLDVLGLVTEGLELALELD